MANLIRQRKAHLPFPASDDSRFPTPDSRLPVPCSLFPLLYRFDISPG
ncbi:MAG: hypothetical protein F6J90_24790 [Moorea sp. SIOASIH]|nr:hypothetical protein [Moorena sp. SIOASIH]NEO39376.1 hypothetical protein [Moorena sp. SIOASIH]